MEITEYNKQLKYLPDFMKDFHDQKDLFKCIQSVYESNERFKEFPNTWVDNHGFIIDYFLWFMSLHGYKLQKIKGDIEVCNIQKTIEDYKTERDKQIVNIFNLKKQS